MMESKITHLDKLEAEFKTREKENLLEQGFQRILQDVKKSEKRKYQQKLDDIKTMDESTRKVI